MKWVTRERIKVDRVACPWLVKNFIDPDAEFVFLPHIPIGLRYGTELSTMYPGRNWDITVRTYPSTPS